MAFKDWDSKNKRMLAIGVLVALLAMGGVAFALASRGADDVRFDPAIGDTPSGGTNVEATSSAGSVTATASLGATTSANGSSGGSGGGSGGSGDGSGSGTSGSQGDAAASTGMKVLFKWWNDTQSKTPQGMEIVIPGVSSWKPDPTAEDAKKVLGPIPYEKPLVLAVYPDGRSGKKIEVRIAVVKSMQPGSEQDAIHIAVSDSGVRVLGTPVDNFDDTYERF